jgi:predicted nucleic acid-binding Zn ribbon protein
MTRQPEDRDSKWEGATGADIQVTPIGDAVSSLLQSRGLGGTVVLARVQAAWEEAAGPEVAARVRPVGLRGRELVCEVSDPAWATQIRLLSDKLLGRLAEVLGHAPADHLAVRISRRSEA